MGVGAASRRWQFRWTALMYAWIYGKPDCTKLLLEKGAEVNATTAVRASPLASRA